MSATASRSLLFTGGCLPEVALRLRPANVCDRFAVIAVYRMRDADPVASRRDAMRLPRDRTHTPKALQTLAGGKRSATTGCVAPIALHPEGMPARLHAVARRCAYGKHTVTSLASLRDAAGTCAVYRRWRCAYLRLMSATASRSLFRAGRASRAFHQTPKHSQSHRHTDHVPAGSVGKSIVGSTLYDGLSRPSSGRLHQLKTPLERPSYRRPGGTPIMCPRDPARWC
jgi:hypothetical protein